MLLMRSIHHLLYISSVNSWHMFSSLNFLDYLLEIGSEARKPYVTAADPKVSTLIHQFFDHSLKVELLLDRLLPLTDVALNLL